VWDSASGDRRQRLQPDGQVQAARFDFQENTLVIWGDNTHFWNLATGAKFWSLDLGASASAGVIFDPKNHGLVVGDSDGRITWWDRNERVKRFAVTPGGYLIRMAASTVKRHLVTLDVAGREARAWDLDSGRLLKRIPYYPDLTAIALTRDGEAFATAGDDGSRNLLEFTRISPTNLVESACKGLHRNLTRDEWNQYMGDEPYRATCANIEPARTR
jgi:hypothetical protein